MVKDPARTGRSDKPGKGSVIIGDEWAFSQYSDQEEMIRRISAIYVRTKSGNDERIRPRGEHRRLRRVRHRVG